jgi:type IV conjugative transfer system protein TraE
MNNIHYTTALDLYKKLTKILAFVCISLSIVVLVLIFLINHFVDKKQIILVPPVMTQSMSVSAVQPDASYLEMMGMYLLQTKLSVTPANVISNYQILKKYVAPQYSNILQKNLDKEIKFIKSQNVSAVFYANYQKADISNLSVVISGTLNESVGTRELKSQDKKYLIEFDYPNGLLRLLAINEIKENNNV